MKHIINRRKFLELFGCSCCGLLVSSCSTVPITERRQLTIFPENRINRQAAAIYQNFKTKTKLITSGNDLKQIEEIGQRIQYSVSTFFTKRNQVDPTKNFEWEYVLVDNDKVKNAWCMPGGKIAVYTGMLKITENKHGLAVVMGHEIAHAVAKHSIERQSQATTVNVGTQILDVFITGGNIGRTRNTIGKHTNIDIYKIGILNPFSRKQESEADYLGLIFSSLAGYDIRESVKLWQRMAKDKKGKEPSQFFSTHPSTKNRIKNLEKWITEVIVEYPPLKI